MSASSTSSSSGPRRSGRPSSGRPELSGEGPETDVDPASLPMLVFDGDCGFCTTSARWGQAKLDLPNVQPWQSIDLDRYGLTEQQCETAVQWIASDGSVHSGHLAVAGALGEGRWGYRIGGRILRLPGVSQVGALVYRLVAKNRYRLPGATDACRI